MEWYQNLYVGQTAKEKLPELIRGVEEARYYLKAYLIIVAPGEVNQLEILTPSEYRKQARRKGDSLIVGIAHTIGEAKELVLQMTEDVYQATGGVELKRYFLKSEIGS